MSKDFDDIRQRFCERIREEITQPVYATVKAVNEKLRTCEVEIGSITRKGVLLYSVENETLNGFCYIPKKDSKVIVTTINGTRSYVSMFSEIDKIVLTIEGVTLHITNNGFTFSNNNSGLKKTLSALCDAITRLTVTTAMGASGTPINATEFTQIKQDLNNYLEA